jgi:hypothetical protein
MRLDRVQIFEPKALRHWVGPAGDLKLNMLERKGF